MNIHTVKIIDSNINFTVNNKTFLLRIEEAGKTDEKMTTSEKEILDVVAKMLVTNKGN